MRNVIAVMLFLASYAGSAYSASIACDDNALAFGRTSKGLSHPYAERSGGQYCDGEVYIPTSGSFELIGIEYVRDPSTTNARVEEVWVRETKGAPGSAIVRAIGGAPGSNYRLDGSLKEGRLTIGSDAALAKLALVSLDLRALAWGPEASTGTLLYYPVGFNQHYEPRSVRLTIKADSDIAQLTLEWQPLPPGTEKKSLRFPTSIAPGHLGEFVLETGEPGTVYSAKITVIFSSGFRTERSFRIAP